MADRARLEAARREMQEMARERPTASGFGRSGRCTLRVSPTAFFNAIDVMGGVQSDGKTCWDDEGFVRDMKRLYPECRVETEGVRVFGMGGRRTMGHAPLTRFGRVKWRKVY